MSLQKKEIYIDISSADIQSLYVQTPSIYKMTSDGISELTPSLFRHTYADGNILWNLPDQSKKLRLEGVNGTFLDVVSRAMIQFVVCADITGKKVVNVAFFESFLCSFENMDGFDSETRNVAECILLCIIRSMCHAEPLLYDICLQKHIISTLLSPRFLIAIDSNHFMMESESDVVRCVDSDTSGNDLITVYVRENLLDFIFDLLKHASPATLLLEVSSILKSLANEAFDELCIISLCSRLHDIVTDNMELLKATSLPQYLIYCWFRSNHDSSLTWPSKYALIRLLDECVASEDTVVNLVLSVGEMINGTLVNTMENLFNLIDSKRTIEFGAAFVVVIMLTATNHPSVNSNAFGQVMNIFMNMGTTLSRVHAKIFDENNSYIMHILFNMVDYMLLEKKLSNPLITRSRQNVLCKTNISPPPLQYMIS